MDANLFLRSYEYFNLQHVPRGAVDNSNSSQGTGDDVATHDQRRVPTTAIIVIVVVISMFLILCLSTALVFYLRRLKPRRMEMTEAGPQNSTQQSDTSLVSKVTMQSSTYSISNPVPPIPSLPSLPADNSGAMVGLDGSQKQNVILRVPVKREAVPASLMPSLTTSDPTALPVLPTINFPFPEPVVIERSKSPTPSVQASLARPGQVLKIVNATSSDFDPIQMPIPQIPEMAQRMSYADLPRIRTEFIRKNGRIAVAPLEHKPSMESIVSRISTSQSDTSTGSSFNKPQGPRPLPIPKVLVPGKTGNETNLKDDSTFT